MRVTLEQWRMLKAVVDHGGFAHAAAAVHKSQSSINHAIHKMEDQLGVKLLQVKGRKAYLTDAGSLLLRRAESLLDSAQHIDDLAQSLSAGEEPEISLAIDQIMPAVYITEVLELFANEYPNTRVQLYETVLSGAREALEEGAVDLAITGAGMPGYLSEPMTGVDFIAVASPRHELCNMGPLNLDDLRNFRQIVTRDSALQDKVDSGWLKAEQRWTVSNLSTAVAMVQRGVGFAWLPMTRVGPLILSDELKVLPLEKGALRSMTLQMYYARGEQSGPGVMRLAELLKEFCVMQCPKHDVPMRAQILAEIEKPEA